MPASLRFFTVDKKGKEKLWAHFERNCHAEEPEICRDEIVKKFARWKRLKGREEGKNSDVKLECFRQDEANDGEVAAGQPQDPSEDCREGGRVAGEVTRQEGRKGE